ncbi:MULTISPECIES: carbohydrate ABC transporter permease [unclassified Paenibacillus]|uniref:carbohydrate ABC transporter permease n=1 Tax=unclassified Paenibacillus TaxID=185978 RepID=UPI0024058985|nr:MULTISPECIES: carbohydrate ABC transporter permease [unclassified Paenibacillus]MDF9843123.1 raffinose/stachyose/melibiose transport system permease protein [Paenibacillus sp. PastF-2]MDF9849665.1 raffinose/stachyose/melibiose transport system permease protein [Paenibacillus sp. PastM-2]MDF9856417.1 raffinose/stachyose/melibiose transport system permease protein [Paenibacillus sp. PastF-1]MDH6481689.1 raffinose/stachyose/melibiose transport system permease protein [Paenibacillus sp. PastH-2]
MDTSRYRPKHFALEIAAILLALVFLSPFYLVLSNSVKSLKEILLDAASFPAVYHWDNYAKVWDAIDFPQAFWNSLSITVLSVIFIVMFSSMAAYQIVRKPSRFNSFVFLLLVSAMIIPFQSLMLQLVRVTSILELRGELYGIVACYLGFGMPLSVFLFHGFIKSVPYELEEAARVDGSNPYGVFFRIVFPLLLPIIVTVIILNTLWIWNDYLLPVLVIGGNKDLTTLPVAVTKFFGQYTKKWDLALAGLVMAITPILLFFLSLQRYIVEGVTAGSVKG